MRISLLYLITEEIDYKIPGLLSYFYKGKDEQESTKEIKTIAEYDPTSTYKYISWIIANHQNKLIRLPEDGEKIKSQLKTYNAYGGEKPQIQNLTPAELYEFIQELSAPSNRELKKRNKHGELLALPDGAELVLSNGKYQVVKITDKHAAMKLADGTNWCVKNEGPAEEYLGKSPLYLVYENKERKYLVHYGRYGDGTQVMDIRDKEVKMPLWLELIEMLSPISGWSVMESSGLAFKCAEIIAKNMRRADANSDSHKILRRLELVIAKNVNYAFPYALNVIKGRWPEAEPTIIKSPETAFQYARDVIKGRWPEAEPTIMKDPSQAYRYAREIIKGRWPEAEPIIIKDPWLAGKYANNVIDGRWPEAEPTIIKDQNAACYYARAVIKDRWPEAEPIIIKDPKEAYFYARDAIKDRWPEAEPIIMEDPRRAYWYASDVIKGRWLEAESTIAKDPTVARDYALHVIKGRWSEAESTMTKTGKRHFYALLDVMYGRQ